MIRKGAFIAASLALSSFALAGCSQNVPKIEDTTVDIDYTQDGIDFARAGKFKKLASYDKSYAFCENLQSNEKPDLDSVDATEWITGCLSVIEKDTTHEIDSSSGSNSGSSSDSPNADSKSTGEILTRLNNAGRTNWSEDPFFESSSVANAYEAEAVFLAQGGETCSVWLFPSKEKAVYAVNDRAFSFISGTYIWGSERSGFGAVLTASRTSETCYSDALRALEW